MPCLLAEEVFGTFLDRATGGVQLDANTCDKVMRLIELMSRSYMNTTSGNALAAAQKFFGPNHAGTARGNEKYRAQLFRDELQDLINTTTPACPVSTLEPSTTSLVRHIALRPPAGWFPGFDRRC